MSSIKEWFRILTVIPLIVILVGTNVYEDPANIFHDESKAIAEAVASGNAAYSASGNGNEREVKRNLIMVMPDETDCIAVGPSLVMCVNKDIVGTDSFINLGVSGSDIYDILAQFGLMDIYGKTTKKVIFCVDSYFFDEFFYAAENDMNRALISYTEYMLDLMNNKDPKPVIAENAGSLKTKIEQAFSVTYFQAARDQIILNNKFLMTDSRWGIVKEGFDGSKPYYGVDGSWTYAAGYQAHDVNWVLDQSINYNIEIQFAKDRHINKYSMVVFEQLINYLLDQGIEVELFLCPLAPTLWDRLEAESEHYFILDEISAYAKEISEKYNLKMIGSYNPYELGMQDKDFYDARHVRREMLGVYFDFGE